MELKHYFRLVLASIFQPGVTSGKKSIMGEGMDYNNTYFYCPAITCKDGFNISLQINNGNYCTSENGYRELGVDWEEVEFGFPTMNDSDLFEYSEGYGYGGYDEDGNELEFDGDNYDVTNSVGRVPLDKMQQILNNHGGIDWDKTLSIEKTLKFINR